MAVGRAVHVCKLDTLREAYALAKKNDGAPGSDGMTFAAIEAQGVEVFLSRSRMNWSGAPMCRYRQGSRKSRRMAARSASFRFRRSATGWRPAEALSFAGSQHLAPDLLFHSVLHEAEALTGMSRPEVIHSPAQHRVDQLDDLIDRLRLVTPEHVLELRQQRRPLLELGRVMGTPSAPQPPPATPPPRGRRPGSGA